MKVKIEKVLEVEQKTSKAGKSYPLSTFTDSEGKLYKEVYGEFKDGQEIEGEWKTDQYGTKFEVARTAGGGSRNDPAVQRNIIRQNSLTNAVAYCTAKAGYMEQKDALKYLSCKEIIQVATYFAKYSEGLITVVTENAPKELPVQQVDEVKEGYASQKDHDESEQVPDQEIDLDEVPFS
jgi:hypothetical protein